MSNISGGIFEIRIPIMFRNKKGKYPVRYVCLKSVPYYDEPPANTQPELGEMGRWMRLETKWGNVASWHTYDAFCIGLILRHVRAAMEDLCPKVSQGIQDILKTPPPQKQKKEETNVENG